MFIIANIVRSQKLDAGETLLQKQMKEEGSCGLRAKVAHPPLHTQTNMVQHRNLQEPLRPILPSLSLDFSWTDKGGGAKELELGVKVEKHFLACGVHEAYTRFSFQVFERGGMALKWRRWPGVAAPS